MDDPEKADIIFVYDYCRLMWALSEEHAEHHWWASEYLKKKLTGTGGPALVSAYNVMTQVRPHTLLFSLTNSRSLLTLWCSVFLTVPLQFRSVCSKMPFLSLSINMIDHPCMLAPVGTFACMWMQLLTAL